MMTLFAVPWCLSIILHWGKIADKHSPVVKPEDNFTAIEDDIIITHPNSYERYTPYVAMLDTMSTAQIVRLYEQYKPLFEQAYEEIGYEGSAFNGTLKKPSTSF